MATRNIGTLTIDMIADMGGFERSMTKAERASADFARLSGRAFKDLGTTAAFQLLEVTRKIQDTETAYEKLTRTKKGPTAQETQAYETLIRQYSDQARALRESETEMGKQQAAFQKLVGVVKPATMELERYKDLLAQVRSLNASGAIGDTASFQAVEAHLLKQIRLLDGTAAAEREAAAAESERIRNVASLVSQLDKQGTAERRIAELRAGLAKIAGDPSSGVSAEQYARMSQSVDKMEAELSGSAAAARALEQQAQADAKAFDQMYRSLFPIEDKLKRIEKQRQLALSQYNSGHIDEATFNKTNAALDSQETGKAPNRDIQSALRQLDPYGAKLREIMQLRESLNQMKLDPSINTSELDRATDSYKKLRTEFLGTDKEARQQSAEMKRVEASFHDMASAIDPLDIKLKQVRQQMADLGKAQAFGFTDTATMERYRGELQRVEQELLKAKNAGHGYALSAKQIKAAQQQLPAQFTDIFTSLQAGQNPLTVFLQQGGQLKDVFGGVGAAAKASAGYLLGLVNPYTLAAGAIALVAVAAYKGSTQMENLNKALAASGKLNIGSQDSYLGIVNSVASSADTTHGTAIKALTDIATTTQATKSQMAEIATDAIRYSKASGQSIEDVVKQYQDAISDPLKSLQTLSEATGTVTAAVYQQMQAYIEAGDKVDAVNLAIKSLSDAHKTATDKMVDQAGTLERTWDTVVGAIEKAWDKMLSIGRAQPLADQLADVNKEIAEFGQPQIVSTPYGPVSSYSSSSEEARNQLLQKRADILAKIKDVETAEKTAEDQRNRNQQAVTTAQAVAGYYQQSLTNAQKLKQANKEIDAAVKAAADDGKPLSKEYVASLYAGAAKQFNNGKERGPKPKQPKKPPEYQNDAAYKYLQTLREQDAVIQSQLNGTAELTAAVKEKAKFEQQILDIQRKQKNGTPLTKDETALYANRGDIEKQLDTNITDETALAARKQMQALAAIQQDFQQQVASENAQQTLKLLGIGIDSEDIENAKALEQIRQQTLDTVAKLREQEAQLDPSSAGYGSQKAQLDAQIANAQSLGQLKLQHTAQFQQATADQTTDWGGISTGFDKGMQAMLKSSKDTSSTIESDFTSAFGTMNDAIVNFVDTGKLSFSSLVEEMINDLARLALQIAESTILQSILGGTSSSVASTFFGAEASSGTSSVISLGALTSALSLYADGGHVTGPGTGTSDSIPAMLSHGEFVLKANAVKKLGVSNLNAVNDGRLHFAEGGYVGRTAPGINKVSTPDRSSNGPKINISTAPGLKSVHAKTTEGDIAIMVAGSFQSDGELSRAFKSNTNVQGRVG